MKFIWELKDFQAEGREDSEFYPFGAVIGRPNSDDRYIIGYVNATGDNPVLIHLSDGMVFAKKDSRQLMVDWLNDNGYYPIVQRKKD